MVESIEAVVRTYCGPAGPSPLRSVDPGLSEVFCFGRQPDDVEFPLMAAENMPL